MSEIKFYFVATLMRFLRITGRTGREANLTQLFSLSFLMRRLKGCFLCKMKQDGKQHWLGLERYEGWTGMPGLSCDCHVIYHSGAQQCSCL